MARGEKEAADIPTSSRSTKVRGAASVRAFIRPEVKSAERKTLAGLEIFDKRDPTGKFRSSTCSALEKLTVTRHR